MKLFAIKKPGQDIGAEELRAHCAARMAKFMVPEQIVFVEDLPRTPTGKVERAKLAELP